jgi:prepilin-type N-terminal cleavage/methylation domain-containing protein
MNVLGTKARWAFTLLELLIVVGIVAILSTVALQNFLLAKNRANQARCASNLKAIAYALYAYKLDLNHYPLADGIAGTQESMGQTSVANGPAANGSWDGVPRILVRLGYLSSEDYLFCPTFKDQFKGERLQRFRYAYNNSAADTGGTIGAPNNVDADSHDIWVARCLWVPPEYSFHPEATDVRFPHGEDHDRENVLMSNGRVELRDGRADFRKTYGIVSP